MTVKIGEMLVQSGAITPRQLEDAIGWQVLYGDRLGTNLVELKFVDEKSLAQALGRQLGCEWACGDLEIDPALLKLIPPVLARRYEIVPWRVDGNKLRMLCSAPGENLPLLDEMGHRLGRAIKPVVAPEFRIHELLRRHFRSTRQLRLLDLGVDTTVRPESRDEAPDLMDGEAFSELYERGNAGRTVRALLKEPVLWSGNAAPHTPTIEVPILELPSETDPALRPAPVPVTGEGVESLASAPVDLVEAGDEPTTSIDQVPAGAAEEVTGEVPVEITERTATDAEVELSEEVPDELIEEITEETPIETAAASAPGEVVVEGEPVGPEELTAFVDSVSAEQWASELREAELGLVVETASVPPPRDMSPLSFAEASQAIREAVDREDVARTVLRYARSVAARAVLLTIQSDVALGWDAIGEGLAAGVARSIVLPLTIPSAFRLVNASRSHFLGPLPPEPGNIRFLKAAGRQWPASALLLPILFQGRVISILYLDNGHREYVSAEIGELLILSQAITRSFEGMIARQRLAG